MRLSTTTLVALIGFGALGTAIAAGGCSSDSGGTTSGNNAGGGGGGSSGPSSGTGFGGGLTPDGGANDGALTEDNACEATSVQANYEQRPADIIFMIDNSGSMTEEILSVQRNINQNFASIIEASGIDYRVIMIARHGSAELTQSVCVEAPLGSGSCTPLPATPNSNPTKFYQYNLDVQSLDSLCVVLDTLKGGIPDREGAAPNGWSEWLRPESLKVFVEITDDNLDCTTTTLASNVTLDDNNDGTVNNETTAAGLLVAQTFDTALTGLAPDLFGTPAERNYTFFSFIGMQENDPPTAPWPADAPVVSRQCQPDSVGPGMGYQSLSAMTGGLRYPICEHASYDAVFQAIANSVISGAKLSCNFDVPEPPVGQTIDLSTVQVEFTPSNGGSKLIFTQVDSLAECTPSAFYIEERKIHLCPDTCSLARGDNAAAVDILYGCSVKPN